MAWPGSGVPGSTSSPTLGSITLNARRCAGFAVDRVQHDFGIDLYVSTYDDAGAVENGFLLVQVKATDRLSLLADRQTIALRVARADLDSWLGDVLPVILVTYDAQMGVAYCLHVQSYLARLGVATPRGLAGTVTVHLTTTDRLDAAAFRRFAARNNANIREGAS